MKVAFLFVEELVMLTYRIVLTAAHCLVARSVNGTHKRFPKVGVFAGGTYINSFNEYILASNSLIPRIYKRNLTENVLMNDYALLVLEKAFTKSSVIGLAKLPELIPGKDDVVTAVGWGERENGKPSEYQRYVHMKIVDDQDCKDRKAKYKSKWSVFCAKSFDPKQGVCRGDSGGPLYHKDTNVVVGVISQAIGNQEYKKNH
uniref:CSON008541 protein n=1 Tax=Culicoides sonorensis TaxID=179676 RepID=A0A336LNT0_CULSO